MSIAPPKIDALPAKCVPNFLPRKSPNKQIPNVTAAMSKAQALAIQISYDAMVKPTERASMEVATPCTSNADMPNPSFWQGHSSLFLMPSYNILPPIKPSKAKAIHGIKISNAWKYCTIVCTQSQPISGIKP